MKNIYSSSIETQINSQLSYWRQQRESIDIRKLLVPKKAREPFITISREYGCGGYIIGEKVSEIFNREFKHVPEWVSYDRKVLDRIMVDMGLSSQLVETLTSSARKQMTNLFQTSFSKFPPQVAVFRKLAEVVRTLALHGHVVIVGRAGRAITSGMESGFHVRIVAPMAWRVEKMVKIAKMNKKDVEKMIVEKSRQREEFLKSFIKFDPSDPHNYHLVINNAEYDTDEVARIILQGMKLKGLL